MDFCNVWTLTFTEKNQTGYVVSTGSGQTLQQAPKIPESAKIMKNQATEPIVTYLLLLVFTLSCQNLRHTQFLSKFQSLL